MRGLPTRLRVQQASTRDLEVRMKPIQGLSPIVPLLGMLVACSLARASRRLLRDPAYLARDQARWRADEH